ncbi:peptide chain release factor 3 [bacterium]|nr:peptide chain release factor 3 [bacterium]
MTQVVMTADEERLAHEVGRRRTFAIISHPDAGKTTLTEKILLYVGAIEQAGSVRARRNQRQAVSDWMSIEQERGISITSSAIQFEYQGRLCNLLDTPGHEDFSEDTYRTLMAVDSAIMVLDSAKGIEAQTRKLFEVCRRQNLPILTFINKLDHPGRDPLELLDEIERVLEIEPAPMNWPIGSGPDFQGVYDLERQQVMRFERTAHGRHRAPVTIAGIEDPVMAQMLGERAHGQLCEEAELLAAAGATFDVDSFRAGDLTPVYFGSALNNFGVERFLDALVALAPSPQPRQSNHGPISPTQAEFSGFVFKIQANMDPKHRDRMAFMRICSGRFEKDMSVLHPRLGRSVRMSRPHRLFAADRETVEEAYPGDVIGLSNPGLFNIGDTVCTGKAILFPPIPPFQPELFGVLRNLKLDKYKQFNKGVEQLQEEGVVQIFYDIDSFRREPIVAAVGQLQFDVVVARLAAEYNVETTVQPSEYTVARWVVGSEKAIEEATWSSQSRRVRDREGRLVALFTSVWQLNYYVERNPDLKFLEIGELALASTI